ncbi:MAG: cation:proton antiporter, partial [Nanoarchaeota archaeon]
DAGISGMSIVAFIISALKTMGIFIGLLIASRFLLSRFINVLFRYPSHELTILATIFTAATAIYLFSSVGLPQTIAAFLAGVLISEQGKNLAPLTEIRPFRDLFLVLFFVLTGMLLNFGFFINSFFLTVAILALIIILKFMIIYTSLRVSRFSPTSSVFISSHLANIGEFSVVIAQIAFISGFLTTKDYNLILSLFVLSLISIPVWTNYARGIVEKIARTGILAKILPKEDREQVFAQKFSNHVVICGHGRVGREVRALLDLANIPYVVVDFNRKVINDLLSLSKYAIYGDPTDREILAATFIKDARVLVIAVPDGFSQKQIVGTALKLNPNLIIICRSHVEDDRYDLVNMGVNTIVVPELEAGLRIGHEVLGLFNVHVPDIDAFVKRLRRTSLL